MGYKEERDELIARAEQLGYHVIHDDTWGEVLWRHGKKSTDPHTHSNWGLDELREMLDGIELGRKLGTAEP